MSGAEVSRETGKIFVTQEVIAALDRQQLALRLGEIIRCDPSLQPDPPDPFVPDERYRARNAHVYAALSHATALGYPCGIDWEHPDFPAAYIDLPTGQVSWHLPRYVNGWDGHSTRVKVERIEMYQQAVDAE